MGGFDDSIITEDIEMSTRILSRTDTSDTTLFYSNLVGTVAMLTEVACSPLASSWC